MLKIAITLLLSLQWLLAGLPHTFCACGCSWLLPDEARGCDVERSVAAASTACPHCEADPENANHLPAGPEGPKHCDCDACHSLLAVTGDSATNAAAATNSAWRHSFSSQVLVQAGPSITDRDSIGWTAALEHRRRTLPVRAMPIFLGHLLF